MLFVDHLPERWGYECYVLFPPFFPTVLSDIQLTWTTVKMGTTYKNGVDACCFCCIYPLILLQTAEPPSPCEVQSPPHLHLRLFFGGVSQPWWRGSNGTDPPRAELMHRNCADRAGVCSHWTWAERMSSLDMPPILAMWRRVCVRMGHTWGRTQRRDRRSPGTIFRALIKLRPKVVISLDFSFTWVITSFLCIQYDLGLLATNKVISDMGKCPFSHVHGWWGWEWDIHGIGQAFATAVALTTTWFGSSEESDRFWVSQSA